ncbi:MAG: glycosyltransferase [Phycisphaerae bacterium]|nr:glycosyltransferase [Phycisphaerae bacterium]
MARRQVLQLLPELDPGGAERVVLTLARHLPHDRFDVSVAALDGRGPLAESFRAAGCAVHDLGGRGRVAAGGAMGLRRLLRTLRPDIVHSHLLRAHLAVAWAPCRAHAGAIVMTEHQADPRGWAVRLLRHASRRAAALTAVSEGVRRRLVACGVPAERVVTVPNGIEIEPFATAEPLPAGAMGLPHGVHAALFVGRLAHQKGLDVLLRAMALPGAADASCHLLVAGEGPERPALESLGERLGVASRVHWLGRRDDVAALMKAAAVVVLPSRWEGLALTLLEAMAAGRPVVATRVEGQADAIDHERTGLLVEPESPEALAAALRRVLEDRAAADAMGREAAAHVAAHFTAAGMAARYAAVYDGC